MRKKAPALAPFLRSHQQGLILAAVLLHPGREYGLSELAGQVGAPLATVHQEVGRLVQAGILRDRTVGRSRLVSAATDSRLVRPLTELVALTYGPIAVVGEEFGALEDVDLVLIFGSWAARYAGQAGLPPRDLDVLVVGAPPRGDVYDAADRARRRLDLPVNAVVSSRSRWEAAADGLIRQIKAAPATIVVDRRPDQ